MGKARNCYGYLSYLSITTYAKISPYGIFFTFLVVWLWISLAWYWTKTNVLKGRQQLGSWETLNYITGEGIYYGVKLILYAINLILNGHVNENY